MFDRTNVFDATAICGRMPVQRLGIGAIKLVWSRSIGGLKRRFEVMHLSGQIRERENVATQLSTICPRMSMDMKDTNRHLRLEWQKC